MIRTIAIAAALMLTAGAASADCVNTPLSGDPATGTYSFKRDCGWVSMIYAYTKTDDAPASSRLMPRIELCKTKDETKIGGDIYKTCEATRPPYKRYVTDANGRRLVCITDLSRPPSESGCHPG